MEKLLLATARHLALELPYTISSMRNNHLLGDALGLLTLARMFPNVSQSPLWARMGEKIFAAQLARHMRHDGSMIEDSLSYHRFVLEMLIIRVLLGGAPVSVAHALREASLYLQKLGAFQGDLPQFGDWDEGRVLASSGNALDVAGSVATGLALSGEMVPPRSLELYDEYAWYVGSTNVSFGPPHVERSDLATVTGGIARAERGPWRLWFKVGSGPSHGHADLTSVWIMHGDDWLVSDPGTGTYNGPLSVRNGLRTSGAHPVRRPKGEDQLVPHRAFRWLRVAHGYLAPPLIFSDRTILFGWHDAYSQAESGMRVARTVVMTESCIAILDSTDPPAGMGASRLSVPLHPQVHLEHSGLIVSGRRIGLFGIDGGSVTRGQWKPFVGWHSRTYGRWEPTTWIEVENESTCTAVWGFGVTPHFQSVGSTATVDGYSFEVLWSPHGAFLAVTDLETGDCYRAGATT